jgi:type II secretory pathway pseudopilin PulG
MKLVTIMVAMIFALGAASVSISAQGRGNGQAKKTTQAKPAARTQTRAVKTEARAAKTAAKADTRAARAETKAAKTNPNQESRLLARLPPGATIQDASLGFKNRGQFIAAVNASTNHNIPFYELKARMTGIPVGSTVQTTTPMSLGQALQSFKVTPPPAPLP